MLNVRRSLARTASLRTPMTNTEVVAEIVLMTKDFLVYMMPIIGTLAGIMFVLSLFFASTTGSLKRFKG